MIYTLCFFSSKYSLFHNANVFGSCFIHILYTECAKIKKKNNSGAKRLIQLLYSTDYPESHRGPSSLLLNSYRTSFLEVKRPGRTSSAEVKERVDLWIYSTSTPSWRLTGQIFIQTTLHLGLLAAEIVSATILQNI